MNQVGPTPRLSVVIPAHDEADHLGATLRSLRRQRITAAVEVIVVDNASTDGTGDLARAAGARVVTEPRLGVCAARQRGVEAARGEIVVSTDADTVHPPDWLARIDAGFRSHDVVAVAGPCVYRDPPWWAAVFPRIGFGLVAAASRLGSPPYVTATNLAYRRSGFPGYDVARTQGGDEAGLLTRMRGWGRIAWQPDNPVYTSSRRLDQGLAYTLLVSYGAHYALNTVLARATGRNVLGVAPPVRAHHRESARRRSRRWALGCSVVVATTAAIRARRSPRLGTRTGLRT